MDNPASSLTIYQETILRSVKWSMNSPLKTLRKSGTFLESLIKVFRCSEPFRSLGPEVRTIIGVKEGYWLGPIRYKQKESEATILYLHGGGYVALSSLLGISSLCYLLKKLRKRYNKHVRVLAIDYTLAPEDPFPNGLNCVERTYNWLVSSGISGSKNVFLCGDSAGGGLTLGLLQKLYLDESITTPLPLGAILLSPWVELSCDSTSYSTNAKFDWIPGHLCQFAAEYYIFGKDGNPARNINQIPQQPKIHKEIILDWLEKVEDNFDIIDFEGNSRLKRLSIELSRRLSGSKRNSEIRAKKRGSKVARIQKRNSRIRNSIIEDSVVDSDDIRRESLDKKSRKSNAFTVMEENPYRDPFISPLHISHHILAKFPPLFISYGGKELFKDDIEMFIQKCIESKKAYKSFGNDDCSGDSLDGQHPDVTVETDKDMVHDYPMFIDVFGKHSKKALDRIVNFVANRIPLSTSVRHSSRMVKSRPQTQILGEFAIKSPTVSSTSTNVDKENSDSFTNMNSMKHPFMNFANNSSNSIPNSRRIPSIAYFQ
jgi:acetyl esterase/lipase